MEHAPQPENLVALFTAAVSDPAARAALARAVFPDEHTISLAVTDADARARLTEGYAKMRPPEDAGDRAWAKVLDVPSDRTEVKVFGAVPSDLADPEPGTTAADQFPGAVREVAPFLDPETVFYEVTATRPGAAAGSRFHLFFFGDGSWHMLGPVWRVLR